MAGVLLRTLVAGGNFEVADLDARTPLVGELVRTLVEADMTLWRLTWMPEVFGG